MHGLESLINTYGYWLMAFGALIEGETFLIAGGIAAQQGLLHVPGLIALALLGSILHDHIFFFIGRVSGHAFLEKKPQYKDKADKVLNMFERFDVGLILILRFAYGFRMIIPAVLGMSHISAWRFFIWDVVGGFIWSCVFIMGGFYFGKGVTILLHKLGDYQSIALRIVAVIVVIGLLILLGWWVKSTLLSKKSTKDK